MLVTNDLINVKLNTGDTIDAKVIITLREDDGYVAILECYGDALGLNRLCDRMAVLHLDFAGNVVDHSQPGATSILPMAVNFTRQ